MPFEQKADIILQICKGLQAAHQKGIIHRDIKPANIRIQDDNTVKIMDFGIARMGASQLTRSGYIIGTLQYMSPEQISGEALDPRTDLFSTGVIAYELFTYTNPFTGRRGRRHHVSHLKHPAAAYHRFARGICHGAESNRDARAGEKQGSTLSGCDARWRRILRNSCFT